MALPHFLRQDGSPNYDDALEELAIAQSLEEYDAATTREQEDIRLAEQLSIIELDEAQHKRRTHIRTRVQAHKFAQRTLPVHGESDNVGAAIMATEHLRNTLVRFRYGTLANIQTLNTLYEEIGHHIREMNASANTPSAPPEPAMEPSTKSPMASSPLKPNPPRPSRELELESQIRRYRALGDDDKVFALTRELQTLKANSWRRERSEMYHHANKPR
jgi:hypothetical protein